MASFKSKVQALKGTLCQQQPANHQNQYNCIPHRHNSTVVLQECRTNNNSCQPKTKQEICLQQPIIIEKKTIAKCDNIPKCTTIKQINCNVSTQSRRKVQPWVPIAISARQKRIDLQTISVPVSQGNKQIEIQIEPDDKKDCIKKLFKKIKKLQDQLKDAAKQRSKIQSQKYRTEVDLEMAKRQLRDKDQQIRRLESRAPKETIKEVIVEKPVEVRVQVPKLVPGPQRIVEKIVQVPKYIEVEKKVPYEVIKEVQKIVTRTVEVPVQVIVQKPVYIDKPVYIEGPPRQVFRDLPPRQIQKIVEVPVEVPVEIPVEYPVYIQKPVVEEQFLIKMRELQAALQAAYRQRAYIISQNEQLRIRVGQLAQNLEMMRRHNSQKNREVEMLLQNSIDYMPFSPHHPDYSLGSVKNSISSHPHRRVI